MPRSSFSAVAVIHNKLTYMGSCGSLGRSRARRATHTWPVVCCGVNVPTGPAGKPGKPALCIVAAALSPISSLDNTTVLILFTLPALIFDKLLQGTEALYSYIHIWGLSGFLC